MQVAKCILQLLPQSEPGNTYLPQEISLNDKETNNDMPAHQDTQGNKLWHIFFVFAWAICSMSTYKRSSGSVTIKVSTSTSQQPVQILLSSSSLSS